MPRRPVVGVMGGARAVPEVEEQARALGAAIAQRGWVLLNGGRAQGVMQASAAGARENGGLVVGVLPGEEDSGTVAEGVEVAVFTGMGQARNTINVLSSDAVVAMPGGSGTLSEAALAVKTDTPLVVLGWTDDELPPTVRRQAQQAGSVDEAIDALEAMLG